MTCIVGIKHSRGVLMAADSAGVGGLEISTRLDRKVFPNGEFVIGGTSSFRMLQLLRYAFVPPKRHADDDVMRFMVVDFVDAVRNCLKAGGFATRDREAESGGDFLVGYSGRLFRIWDNYQVAEADRDYEACGCGEAYARGALFANAELPPEERALQALRAAEMHSAGVRGPFHIERRESQTTIGA
jgi:ATP-dependent protease HslVU (ClpYQ) peptidase subunit